MYYEIIYFDHEPSIEEQNIIQGKLFNLGYKWNRRCNHFCYLLRLNAYILHSQKIITYINCEDYKNFETVLEEKYEIDTKIPKKRIIRSDQFLKSKISTMETE